MSVLATPDGEGLGILIKCTPDSSGFWVKNMHVKHPINNTRSVLDARKEHHQY